MCKSSATSTGDFRGLTGSFGRILFKLINLFRFLNYWNYCENQFFDAIPNFSCCVLSKDILNYMYGKYE